MFRIAQRGTRANSAEERGVRVEGTHIPVHPASSSIFDNLETDASLPVTVCWVMADGGARVLRRDPGADVPKWPSQLPKRRTRPG